ncbi:MAG: hypothetical protein C5B57_12735 [Blastocatellia bacterium]|nr:MAG: hypothetical protein C5B57_12735 [Blastocatellia bacterium]
MRPRRLHVLREHGPPPPRPCSDADAAFALGHVELLCEHAARPTSTRRTHLLDEQASGNRRQPADVRLVESDCGARIGPVGAVLSIRASHPRLTCGEVPARAIAHSRPEPDVVLRLLLRAWRLARGCVPHWSSGGSIIWRRSAMAIDSTEGLASCLYFGRVAHLRRKPVAHRFRYDVCSWLVDLAEVSELDARFKLFSFNRPNVFSFFERDHGPRDGSPLRPWVDRQLSAAGIELNGGAVRILCFPRLFGYAFNPLSVWFCHRSDFQLAAILLEVSNVAGDWHSYLIPVVPTKSVHDTVSATFEKSFHVSAFIGMSARYQCRVTRPGEHIAVRIRESEHGADTLFATWIGRRRELTNEQLMCALARYPLMTFKVSAAIYWQALQLVRKGVPRHPRSPDCPRGGVTNVGADESNRHSDGRSGSPVKL